MKKMISIVFAASLLIGAAAPAAACSPGEYARKVGEFALATKAAFERDPGGDPARQARVREITERYAPQVQKSGGTAFDLLCREYDALLAVYK
jgi:hypothetical protein